MAKQLPRNRAEGVEILTTEKNITRVTILLAFADGHRHLQRVRGHSPVCYLMQSSRPPGSRQE